MGGKRAKSAVFAGRKEKTVGGLRKDALKKNSKGKIVSKKASARAQKAYAAGRGFRKWAEATKNARKALGLAGFVPVGGKTAAGKALYAKAKAFLSARGFVPLALPWVSRAAVCTLLRNHARMAKISRTSLRRHLSSRDASPQKCS